MDMFQVGYVYTIDDFSGQGAGLICFYSLKNPSHPEYVAISVFVGLLG